MPIVEVMLYLSVVLSGRCFNVAPADVMPTPTPEYSCNSPIDSESVDRPLSLSLRHTRAVVRKTIDPNRSHCRFSSYPR